MSTALWTQIENLEPRMLLSTVWLDLEVNDTADTFQLYAQASVGDNAGICAVSIPLTGTISTMTACAPTGIDAGGNLKGFSQNFTVGGQIILSQNTMDASTFLLGVGQTSGSFAKFGGGTVSWSVPVLVAEGSFTGAAPTIDWGSVGANLFKTGGSPVPPGSATNIVAMEAVKDVRMDRAVLYDAPPELNYNSISPADLATRYGFFFDADISNSANLTAASIATPDHTSYALSKTQGASTQDWGYALVTTNQADLSHFTDGDYTLTLTHAGGTTETKIISFTDAGDPIAAPTQQPNLTSPAMGDWGVSPRPTITWDAVTDANVTGIKVEIKNPLTDAVVVSVDLARTATSWQPAAGALTTNKVYLVTLSFVAGPASDPGAAIPVEAAKSTSTAAVFNTYTGNILIPISGVAIEKGIVHDSAGGTTYQFDVTVAGAMNLLPFLSVQTPSGAWYTIDQTATGQRYFHAASGDAAELADFTDGTYTLWVDRGQDIYATTAFSFEDPTTHDALAQPAQVPTLLTPAADATAVAIRPEFTWGAVTDPDVNGTTLVVYQPTSATNDIRQDLATTVTSYQQAQALGYATEYEWQIGFSNSGDTSNADGVSYFVDKYQTASSRFTTEARKVDLTGHLGASTLPPLGVENRPIVGTLGVVVTNSDQSNSPAAVGQKVIIQVLARSEGDPDNPITLATLANQSISALAIGASKTFSVPVNYASGLSIGQYTIEALLTAAMPAGTTDPDTSNDLLTQNGSGAAITMNIQASFIDLQARLSSAVVMPWVTVSGAGAKLVVPVFVTNAGNIPLPLAKTINLTLSARPAGAADDSSDVLLTTLSNQSVSLLGVGKYKLFKLVGALPAGLDSDHYVLVAKVDTGNTVVETNENNNAGVTARSMDVIRGYVDLTGTFGLVTVPPAVVTGTTLLSKRVLVNVKNDGTVPLPLGQTINVVLYARPMAGGADVELARIDNRIVSKLAAGATRPVVMIVNVPADLPADSYELVAVITPNGGLEENDDGNNEASLNAAGQPVRLVSDVSFVDLTTRLGNSYLPPSVVTGSLVASKAQVIVTNSGNTAVPLGAKTDIILKARNEDDGTSIDLGTYANYPLSLMAAGASRTVTVVVNLPTGLADGSYHLEAQLVPSGVVQDTENDSASTNAAGQQVDIISAAPFVDLQPSLGRMKMPAKTVISGDATKVVMPVKVQNIGSSALGLGATVDIEIYARSVEGGGETLLTTLTDRSVSLLGANRTRTFPAIVRLPLGLEADDYELVAKVDTSNDIAESVEDNNSVATTSHLHVARGFVDLAGTFSSVLLPAQVNAGQRIFGSVRVSVQNLGRVALPAGQLVTLVLYARPQGGTGDTDVELSRTLSLSVSKLAPGATRLLTIAVNNLAGLTADSYTLVASIAPVQPLTEELSGNNLVTQTAAGSEPAITVV